MNALEAKIGAGQVEELIMQVSIVIAFGIFVNAPLNSLISATLNTILVPISQASRELSLARKMLSWQPWEPLIEQAPKDQWKWPL